MDSRSEAKKLNKNCKVVCSFINFLELGILCLQRSDIGFLIIPLPGAVGNPIKTSEELCIENISGVLRVTREKKLTPISLSNGSRENLPVRERRGFDAV